MNSINITNARQNLFQLVSDVNVGYNPITIVNSKGDNAVLISENEWKNIEETLYLESIPGFSKSIRSNQTSLKITIFISMFQKEPYQKMDQVQGLL